MGTYSQMLSLQVSCDSTPCEINHFVFVRGVFVLEHLVIVHDKPRGSVHSVHRPVIMVGEQFPHLPDDHAWGLIHRCCHCKFPVIPLHAKSIILFLFEVFVLEHLLVIVHDKPHGSVHSVPRPVIMVGEQFPHLPDDHAWGLIHRCCHCKFPVIPLHAKSITLFLFEVLVLEHLVNCP